MIQGESSSHLFSFYPSSTQCSSTVRRVVGPDSEGKNIVRVFQAHNSQLIYEVIGIFQHVVIGVRQWDENLLMLTKALAEYFAPFRHAEGKAAIEGTWPIGSCRAKRPHSLPCSGPSVTSPFPHCGKNTMILRFARKYMRGE